MDDCSGFGILHDVLRECRFCSRKSACFAMEKQNRHEEGRIETLEMQVDLLKRIVRGLTDQLASAGFVFAKRVAEENNIHRLISPTTNVRCANSGVSANDVDLRKDIPRYFEEFMEYVDSLPSIERSVTNKRFEKNRVEYYGRSRKPFFALTYRGHISVKIELLEYVSPPFAFFKTRGKVEGRIFDLPAILSGGPFELYDRDLIDQFFGQLEYVSAKIAEVT